MLPRRHPLSLLHPTKRRILEYRLFRRFLLAWLLDLYYRYLIALISTWNCQWSLSTQRTLHKFEISERVESVLTLWIIIIFWLFPFLRSSVIIVYFYFINPFLPFLRWLLTRETSILVHFQRFQQIFRISSITEILHFLIILSDRTFHWKETLSRKPTIWCLASMCALTIHM